MFPTGESPEACDAKNKFYNKLKIKTKQMYCIKLQNVLQYKQVIVAQFGQKEEKICKK